MWLNKAMQTEKQQRKDEEKKLSRIKWTDCLTKLLKGSLWNSLKGSNNAKSAVRSTSSLFPSLVPLNHRFNTAASRPLLISVKSVPPLAKCSGVSLPKKLWNLSSCLPRKQKARHKKAGGWLIIVNFWRESKTVANKPAPVLFNASTVGLGVTFPTGSYQSNPHVCWLVMLFSSPWFCQSWLVAAKTYFSKWKIQHPLWVSLGITLKLWEKKNGWLKRYLPGGYRQLWSEERENTNGRKTAVRRQE